MGWEGGAKGCSSRSCRTVAVLPYLPPQAAVPLGCLYEHQIPVLRLCVGESGEQGG